MVMLVMWSCRTCGLAGEFLIDCVKGSSYIFLRKCPYTSMKYFPFSSFLLLLSVKFCSSAGPLSLNHMAYGPHLIVLSHCSASFSPLLSSPTVSRPAATPSISSILYNILSPPCHLEDFSVTEQKGYYSRLTPLPQDQLSRTDCLTFGTHNPVLFYRS